MELLQQHPWRDAVLQRLAIEQEQQPVETDNLDWITIENEMTKVGTISHDSVNITQIQQRILKLLLTETKDFRLLAHLIYTLQRSGNAENILLATAILADYVALYWDIAAPQKLKKRILHMIMQRFSMVKTDFQTHSIEPQRAAAIAHFLRLKERVQIAYAAICEDIDKLMIAYGKAVAPLRSELNDATLIAAHIASAESDQHTTEQTSTKTVPDITLDTSSEQTWRRTLLKIIEIENSRCAYQPIVFQLRRHSVWLNVHAPAANNGITTVPPLPIEKLSDYEREQERPTVDVWQKIENTIAYSPFWFDGHYLSAQIAHKLGFHTIAEIIRNELRYFLARYPGCETLRYSDGQPFATQQTLRWLAKKTAVVNPAPLDEQALTLFADEGLDAALRYLEQQSSDQLRDISYAQLQMIQLIDKAGCRNLAKTQLAQLNDTVQQLDVRAWEPSFFEKCDAVAALISNKE